jgi:hypothetical protein
VFRLNDRLRRTLFRRRCHRRSDQRLRSWRGKNSIPTARPCRPCWYRASGNRRIGPPRSYTSSRPHDQEPPLVRVSETPSKWSFISGRTPRQSRGVSPGRLAMSAVRAFVSGSRPTTPLQAAQRFLPSGPLSKTLETRGPAVGWQSREQREGPTRASRHGGEAFGRVIVAAGIGRMRPLSAEQHARAARHSVIYRLRL